MREELSGLNHCAVPFLSRAVADLCWYYYIAYDVKLNILPATECFTSNWNDQT